MINGYVPLNDKNEFRKEHPEISVTALVTVIELCQRTDDERKQFLKSSTNKEVYDINKIHEHAKSCVWCQNWLAWHKNEELRYQEKTPPSHLTRWEKEQLGALKAALASR